MAESDTFKQQFIDSKPNSPFTAPVQQEPFKARQHVCDVAQRVRSDMIMINIFQHVKTREREKERKRDRQTDTDCDMLYLLLFYQRLRLRCQPLDSNITFFKKKGLY